jgi:hypothetical protein
LSKGPIRYVLSTIAVHLPRTIPERVSVVSIAMPVFFRISIAPSVLWKLVRGC